MLWDYRVFFSTLSSALILTGTPIETDRLGLIVTDDAPLQATADPALQPQTAAEQAQPPQTAQTTIPAAAPPDEEGHDVVVKSRPYSAADPMQALNLKSFEFTENVDKAVVGPVAIGFARVVPAPARDGLGNFLYNLHEPGYFANFILQHKIGKAAETLVRFVINSTIGVGGLFDIAKRRPFRLPRRENGLSNTAAFYGVKNGPYLFLPVFGPTTVRDIIGSTLDQLVLPIFVGSPFNRLEYNIPTTAARTLDKRAAFDDTITHMRADKRDLYTARRELYLSRRQAEIDALHAKRPRRAETPAAEALSEPTAPPPPPPQP